MSTTSTYSTTSGEYVNVVDNQAQAGKISSEQYVSPSLFLGLDLSLITDFPVS